MGERASAATIGPGTVLDATYRIERQLGEGGMGVVWEASHLRVPKRVAIKVLHAADAEALARFRQEAEVASRLGHPNIVDVLDFNSADGTPYMVMELLHGESLATRLESGPLPVDRAIAIARQIASALQAAHDAGVIHRDLKPANVFLVPRELDGEPTDEVKVLDFGISKVHGSQVVRTNEGAVIGTPQYMAPEQAAARHDELDAHTDQFALGAITYEMLAGKPPFDGDNATQVMFKIVYESPPALATLVTDLVPAVEAAVMRALATRPDERFPSVSAYVAALSGRPLETGPVERMNQNTLPAGPRRVETATTAAAATSADSPRARESRREPRSRRMIALAAVGIAAVIGVYVVARRHDDEPVRNAVLVPTSDASITAIGAAVRDASPGDASVAVASTPDAGAAAPTDAGVRVANVPVREAIPKDIAAELDLAEKELAAGDPDSLANADARVRRTLRQHEYARANTLLAVIGCARHDVAQAHGWMRRAGAGNWAAIRARCAKLAFPIDDP